jgi:hypothetical protein
VRYSFDSLLKFFIGKYEKERKEGIEKEGIGFNVARPYGLYPA